MSDNSAIMMENVSRSYNSVLALKEINLTWNKGILGLIGPNGAGKSTLIKILCTLIRPDTGHAYIFNREVVKETLEVRKQIGVLHENPVFHPTMHVFSSLWWVGRIRNLSETIARRQVLELLEYFGLIAVKDKQIKTLSAGMKQKYGLIQAFLGHPPLIILDEPTSNLDPDARRLYEMYVQRVRKENGSSFFISSHVLGELERLCEGFVFIFNGKIVQMGTKKELLTNSKTQQFRIVTQNVKHFLSILKEDGYKIENVSENEIIISGLETERIEDITLLLRGKECGDTNFTIVPLTGGIESIYHQLSEQNKQKC